MVDMELNNLNTAPDTFNEMLHLYWCSEDDGLSSRLLQISTNDSCD